MHIAEVGWLKWTPVMWEEVLLVIVCLMRERFWTWRMRDELRLQVTAELPQPADQWL